MFASASATLAEDLQGLKAAKTLQDNKQICTMTTLFFTLLLFTALVAAAMTSVKAVIVTSVLEGKKKKRESQGAIFSA